VRVKQPQRAPGMLLPLRLLPTLHAGSFLLFPLTCAWALTCHRFQGQTVDHLCLHAHQSSPHRAMIVNKQYYYVALSRVRTLLGLSMTELLEADPEYYSSDTSLLVHDANLAVQTLQTRLRYAEAWGLPASEVAEELLVAQGLHGTLILRLAEDLQRAAFLASVGVTPKKAKARKAPQHPKTATPKRLRVGTPPRNGFAVIRICRPCICPQAGAGQRRSALTSSSIFRVVASLPVCSSAGPSLHSIGSNDISILHVCKGVRFFWPCICPQAGTGLALAGTCCFIRHVRIFVGHHLELCTCSACDCKLMAAGAHLISFTHLP
jgi:hypothetical protein